MPKSTNAQSGSHSFAYDFRKLMEKWNRLWLKNKVYQAIDFSSKPKKYVLSEFPYASGAGLHMGHTRNYSIMDVYARLHRMKGYNVLYPMGWDNFGLPAYNYAMKVDKDPHDVSASNIKNFKKQLQSLGLSIDWSREIDTTSPKMYKWTQWIFIQLYKHYYDPDYVRPDGGKGMARPIEELPVPQEVKDKGIKAVKEYQDKFRLAYKAYKKVHYCPFCKSVIANEEVDPDGTHERCHNPVVEKDAEQWMFRITAYADRLIEDLSIPDFPESVKQAQINWIGRSYGAEIHFKVKEAQETLTVFTTRPDTIYGVTFMAVSPESDFVKKNLDKFNEPEKIKEYIKTIRGQLIKGIREDYEKTGIDTGWHVINPITHEEVPIFITNYVLEDVGTGYVMGVPGHDIRDFDFAVKYNLPVKRVIVGEDGDTSAIDSRDKVVAKDGKHINSDIIDGLNVSEAKEKIIKYLEDHNLGKRVTRYKLRDWVFSRQHYWGEPTPMVYCEKCGWNPIKEEDLPLLLPRLQDYHMGEDGSSPLEKATEWIKTECPVCGGPARRETDVMPNWAGSNWYYIRYTDPNNDKALADYKKIEYWLPVDIYDGGAEHNTLHLLYSRFIFKFLYDIGVVPMPEPYQKRRTHGLILGRDGKKMSKSRGNVINPDDIISEYGPDVVRLYMMFIGPYDGTLPWSDKAISGVKRFLDKWYKYIESAIENEQEVEVSSEYKADVQRLMKKVEEDIINLKFNTAVAAYMEFMNNHIDEIPNREFAEILIKIMAPMAPFVAEELWHKLTSASENESVHTQPWPKYDESLISQSKVEIVVQINGKVRGKVKVDYNMSEEQVMNMVKSDERIAKYLSGHIKKVVYVPNKIINIVV